MCKVEIGSFNFGLLGRFLFEKIEKAKKVKSSILSWTRMSWHPLANKKKGESPKIGLLPHFLYKKGCLPFKVVPLFSLALC